MHTARLTIVYTLYAFCYSRWFQFMRLYVCNAFVRPFFAVYMHESVTFQTTLIQFIFRYFFSDQNFQWIFHFNDFLLCSALIFFKLLFVLKRKPKKMRKRFFQYYKRLKLDRYHAKIQSVFILSRWLILCYDYLIQLKKISMKFVIFLRHFFITAHFHLYPEIKIFSHSNVFSLEFFLT